MTSLLLRAYLGSLRPTDEAGKDYVRKIKQDEVVRADIVRVRNPRQHRMYWALITLIHPQQDQWPTVESLSKAILCAIGHGEIVKSKSGICWLKPKSIAWGNLGQDEFNEIFDRAIKLICEKILPGMSDDDLRREVLDMIGG